MALIIANLFCFNPGQRAAIQQRLAATANIFILPEVRPSLRHWLQDEAHNAGYTLVAAPTNNQMTLCLLSRLSIAQSPMIDQESLPVDHSSALS